ncbi:RICIN domain-containing protein [Microlunatus ginsengisoli]|uniref:Ricin B lectin domain-containing protein n=1 Tax=Microlunatus ginsengisoli TaxID=363863 RepID=A0ABP7ACT5_9ACTN
MNQKSHLTCDMSTAPDTPKDRAAEYQHLFATALCGRDRTERMVRFRFRADAVDEAQVRSLAAREQACCPFFHIRLSTVDDQLWWATTVEDDPQAKILLDEFARLPDQHTPAATVADDLIDRNMLITSAADPSSTTPVQAEPGDHRRTRTAARALLTTIAAIMLLLAVGPQAQAVVVPDDYYQVVNHQTGECLDVWGASPAHAANVGVWRCVGADNQLWHLEPLTTNDTPNGWYRVRVLHTDMCLDVAYRGTYNGADVIQGTCMDPTPQTSYNQHWRLARIGGYYQLVNRYSGKCLDKTGSGDVVQWACGDSTKWWQQWSFR